MSTWSLTPIETAVLFGVAGLDQLPAPLSARLADSDDHAADVLLENTASRLAGTITPAQVTALQVLAGPTHRLAVIATPPTAPDRGVRIASGFRDGHAVIASQNTDPTDPHAATGGTITITATTLAKWITEVVAALPRIGPGRLPPVADLKPGDSDDGPPDSVLTSTDDEDQARARYALVNAPADLLGEFRLEQLDPQTTTVLSRSSILVADITGDGRYAVYGRRKRSAKPVSPGELVTLLTDEMSDLKNHVKSGAAAPSN